MQPTGHSVNDVVPDSGDEVEPASRAEWRQWLTEHHATSSGVWLIWHKKGSRRRGVRLDEAMEEALCFGWIDSRLRPLDGERSALRFTPRRRGGTWSRVNKRRIEALMAAGLMTDAGLRAIDAARRDGSWNALDAAESLELPPDLEAALDADRMARVRFDAQARSARKMELWRILSAKRPETRARRIAELVHRLQL
jgi:uncharacterized protein YdeI (YjbR/CyaY-like superfamily)